MNSNYEYECLDGCGGILNYSHDEVAKCNKCGKFFNFDEIQFAEYCDRYFEEIKDLEDYS